MDKSVTTTAPYFDAARGRPRAGRASRGAERRRARRPGRPCSSGSRSCCARARAEAARQLAADGNGRRCAEGLSDVPGRADPPRLRLHVANVYRATNPSDAEHMAIIATGGYGRGLLAPFSDVDLLFLLPYKQTPWGESVVEYMLYLLWDLGLKVGHATRTVEQSLKLARADITIRTALLDLAPDPGRRAAVRGADAALPARGGAAARRASSSRPSSPSATSATAAPASRAIASSPTSRTARAACATCTRCTGSPSTSTATASSDGAVEAPIFTSDEYATFRRCEDFLWTVRCHLHFLTGRAEERLTFDVQTAMAERLGYVGAPRPARGRALHEALLPGRQGRRRPHHHPVLGAGDRAGQGVARARAAAQSAELAHAAPHPHHQRFPHRQRPPQRRRRRGLQARSRQPHPLLRQGRADGRLLPSQRGAPAAPVAAADRRQAAQRPGGQPHLPGHAVLGQEPRADAAAHERGRRARPLRARLRPGRVDDAVQHVPPLHGGRAPDPHRRRAVRHRARRGRRVPPAVDLDLQDHPAPPRALRGGLPARHRQGPRRGPLAWSAPASPARSARASA